MFMTCDIVCPNWKISRFLWSQTLDDFFNIWEVNSEFKLFGCSAFSFNIQNHSQFFNRNFANSLSIFIVM